MKNIKKGKLISIMIIFIATIVIGINKVNALDITIPVEDTNNRKINYTITTKVKETEIKDERTKKIYNRLLNGNSVDNLSTDLVGIYCQITGVPHGGFNSYMKKGAEVNATYDELPVKAFIYSDPYRLTNLRGWCHGYTQLLAWRYGGFNLNAAKSSKGAVKMWNEALAYENYGNNRKDWEAEKGRTYTGPSVIQTKPKSINFLAGPYQIDYVMGEAEGTFISEIQSMKAKDMNGNIIKHSTASDLGDIPYWYVADANGNPINNGNYGNFPMPNQKFYIKVENFVQSKLFLSVVIENVEATADYIRLDGVGYQKIKGGFRCNNCTKKIEKCNNIVAYEKSWCTANNLCPDCKIEQENDKEKFFHIMHTYYDKNKPKYCRDYVNLDTTRMCSKCKEQFCYAKFSIKTYVEDETHGGMTKTTVTAQCSQATEYMDFTSQPQELVGYAKREVTEFNIEIEVLLDCVDLALRKFATGVIAAENIKLDNNGKIITNEMQDLKVSREPQVDTSNLRNYQDTTAIYKHTKKPIQVKAGDVIEYTIRVYNEGTADGYAIEVRDHLPETLEFVSGVIDGVDYRWKVSYENDLTVLTTDFLANEKLIAFSREGVFRPKNVGADGLDYRDLKVICRVKENAEANEGITNIAQVTKYKDQYNNILKGDIDSQPANVVFPSTRQEWSDYNGGGGSGDYILGQQDDDDFEKLILWYTDMGGTVWEDGQEGKQEERDGVLTDKDERFAGIEVNLYQYTRKDENSNEEWNKIGEFTTGVDGTYKFTKLSNEVIKNLSPDFPEQESRLEVNKNYIIKFGYGGQQYCPVGVTLLTNKNYGPTKSAAEDEGRNELNAKFFEIVNGTSKLSNGNTSISLKYDKDEQKHTSTLIRDRARQEGEKLWQDSMIYATTHGFSGTNPHVDYINLGLMERAQINFGIMTDVEKAELTINGKTSTYEHNKRDEGTAIDIELKAQNLSTVYNQAIYKSDYIYRIEDYRQDKLQESGITKENLANAGELEVYPIYKIKVKNYSSKSGNITELVNHFTTEYKIVDSWYVKGDATGKVEWVESSEENGYKTVYTSSTKNISIGANEDLYVYIKYQVQKNEDRSIKLGEKYTYTEITGYSSAEGLIDTNSEPGNMDMSTIDKYVATYEDDTDRAPGLNLKLGDEPVAREMTGFVFEDTVSGQDSDGVNIGNGTFEQSENKVNNVRVQLIELVKLNDGRTYEYIWQEIFTGNGKVSYMNRNGNLQTNNKQVEVGTGEYKFTEYIPGNYIIRFIYGDTTYNLNYSGQDFKSTTYKGFGENTSSAKDNKTRRKQVMDYSTTITNEKGQVLAATSQDSKEELKVKLAQNTWMNADTQEVMDITVNMENPGHKVNFGLLRRPKAELTMIKEVIGLKVTHNGIIYVDTANGIETGLKKLPDGNYSLELDDELLNGATLDATYSVKIVNTGEKDTLYNYFEGDANYGSNQHELITTSADRICDYPENIGYDEGTNLDWTTQNIDTSILSKEVQDKINNDKPLVITTTKLTKALKPGEETPKVPMTTSKLMSVGGDDDMIYSNVAEIVQVTNKVGRRDEKSIPGDYVPLSHITTQVDTDDATVTVTDPTGSIAPQIYYILSITIGAMLIAGIVCIKKFVNKK